MNFYIYEFPNVYWHGKVHSDCCTVFLWDLVYEIYSTEWRPSIGACRLFWLLLRAEMAVLNHFFAKYIFYICDKARTKIWPRFCSFRGLIPRLWFFAPFPADFAPFLVVSQQSTGTCMRSQPPTRWSKQNSKWQYRDHLVGRLNTEFSEFDFNTIYHAVQNRGEGGRHPHQSEQFAQLPNLTPHHLLLPPPNLTLPYSLTLLCNACSLWRCLTMLFSETIFSELLNDLLWFSVFLLSLTSFSSSWLSLL